MATAEIDEITTEVIVAETATDLHTEDMTEVNELLLNFFRPVEDFPVAIC